jgi:hypothetical protein
MGRPAAAPRARTGRAGKTLADRVDRMFLVAQRARHLENVFVPCREGLFLSPMDRTSHAKDTLHALHNGSVPTAD